MTLRFVGTFAEILGKFPLRLEKFGQKVEIPEAILPDVLGDAGAALIPDSMFPMPWTNKSVDELSKSQEFMTASADQNLKREAQEIYAKWAAEGFPMTEVK